jgi:UTP--glucose-1-phosphate uridylyltransferase
MLVQQYIEANEAFLVLMGDDFVFHPDGASEVAALIKTYESSRCNAAMACAQLPKSEIVKYGVVETEDISGHLQFKSMIEKPKPEQINTNLANISKYIFGHDMFEYLKRVKPNNENGEYYIIDAINEYAADKHSVAVHKITGQYLDGGTLEGWLNANQVVAKARGLIQ